MIAVRVVWAFFTPGSRKAFTPLPTASLCCCRRCSTSVKAVQPVANTFKSSQKVTTAVAGPGIRLLEQYYCGVGCVLQT